jgi:hypothetical protein
MRRYFDIKIPLYTDPEPPHRVFGDDTEMPEFIQEMFSDNQVGELTLACYRDIIDDPGDYDNPPYSEVDNFCEYATLTVSGDEVGLSPEQECELESLFWEYVENEELDWMTASD